MPKLNTIHGNYNFNFFFPTTFIFQILTLCTTGLSYGILMISITEQLSPHTLPTKVHLHSNFTMSHYIQFFCSNHIHCSFTHMYTFYFTCQILCSTFCSQNDNFFSNLKYNLILSKYPSWHLELPFKPSYSFHCIFFLIYELTQDFISFNPGFRSCRGILQYMIPQA